MTQNNCDRVGSDNSPCCARVSYAQSAVGHFSVLIVNGVALSEKERACYDAALEVLTGFIKGGAGE